MLYPSLDSHAHREWKQSPCNFCGNWLKAWWMSKLRLFFVKFQHLEELPIQGSFSDAELAKNHIQQVLRRGLANDLADGIHRDAQVHRGQFQRGASAQRIDGSRRRLARAAQGVLMPRVDHDLEHFGLDFAGPREVFDRVFQRLNALPGEATDINKLLARYLKLRRQINFVAHQDTFLAREFREKLFVGVGQRLGSIENVQNKFCLLE